MKKIMTSVLTPCLTDGEYQWIESSEEEGGREWDGDILGYILNSSPDEEEADEALHRDYCGAIHNLPEGAIIWVDPDGVPRQIWWAEEINAD